MARRPPTREWRDDIPRSFSYTPPAQAPAARVPAADARSVQVRGGLRLLVGLLLHR